MSLVTRSARPPLLGPIDVRVAQVSLAVTETYPETDSATGIVGVVLRAFFPHNDWQVPHRPAASVRASAPAGSRLGSRPGAPRTVQPRTALARRRLLFLESRPQAKTFPLFRTRGWPTAPMNVPNQPGAVNLRSANSEAPWARDAQAVDRRHATWRRVASWSGLLGPRDV